MSWIDRYLRMTNMAYAAVTAGSSVGGFLFSWLAGYLIEYQRVQSIFYLSLVCCVAALALMIIMQVLGSRHGDRYTSAVTELVYDIQGHEQQIDTAPLLT